MSLSLPTPSSRSLQIVKIVLYVLAVLVLVLGLIASISLMINADYMVANALLPLQLMGIGEFSGLFAYTLTRFLINLGVIILILTLVLSALLYATGRLIGHIARLEARLTSLEGRS